EQEREQLRHIFLKLVRPGQGTEDTRQVASLEQIRAEDRDLVTRLADKRLIVTGRDEECGEETIEVVHEALIRRWRTLRKWVDEEREFLVWQEKLRVLLGQWEESGKDEGALLRGLPLDEALRWRKSHKDYLGDKERKFVWVSKKLRKRERRAEEKAHKERKKIFLEANYNLAKVFEEKALYALKKAKENRSNERYQKAMLFAWASLKQEIENDRVALELRAVGKLFDCSIFHAGLVELSLFREQHEIDVFNVAFSPDGKLLASVLKHEIVLWDIINNKELSVFKDSNADFCSTVPHVLGEENKAVSSKKSANDRRFTLFKRATRGVSFSPDGKILAAASGKKIIQLWDIATGKKLTSLKAHRECINCLMFSPDSKKIASVSKSTIEIFDIINERKLSVFKESKYIFSLAFSPDGKILASTSGGLVSSGNICLRDITTGRENNIYHERAVFGVAFSPDGETIASASGDGAVRIWDIDSCKGLAIFTDHDGPVFSVVFSPDGKKIASASGDGTVRIWDISSGEKIAVFMGHEGAVFNLSFNADGRTITSASDDKTVRLWEIVNDRSTYLRHKEAVNSIAFSPDSSTIVSASDDSTVRLWNITRSEQLVVFKEHKDSVNSVAFSPDGRTIGSGSDDTTIRIYNIISKKEMAILRGHEDTVSCVSFSPDGKMLASASHDATVRLWDVVSGEELAVFRGHQGAVLSVTFSPNGKTIASSSNDKTVQLWNVASNSKVIVFKGYEGVVLSVIFSLDSKMLASVSEDNSIRLWDITVGRELSFFRGDEDNILSVAFSPDGKMLASASWGMFYKDDNIIQIRDATSGRKLNISKGHESAVFSVAFSPDNRILASGSDDNTIRLWDIRSYTLFMNNLRNPTPLYHTFIEAVKFLWQLDVQGLEIVETKRRTPADLKKYGTLLAPPPPGQSKFDQVLEWAEKQQEK
ncbi:MAG: hypothetical protein D3916_08510, partial [Candidatus Electrothrix sp. MAN1_4]|nr:hypothetical protein [Candidatus Electrothrix sp. MAN1_4]